MTLNAAQACMLHEHVLTCSGCSGNGSANSSSGSHRFHISHQTPCHLSRVQVHRPVLVAGGLAGNGLQLGRRRHARLGALAAREAHAWGAQHRQQRVAHLARRPQPALGKGLRGSSFDVSAQLENCPAAPAAHRPPRPPTIAGSSRAGSSRRSAPQQAFSQTKLFTNRLWELATSPADHSRLFAKVCAAASQLGRMLAAGCPEAFWHHGAVCATGRKPGNPVSSSCSLSRKEHAQGNRPTSSRRRSAAAAAVPEGPSRKDSGERAMTDSPAATSVGCSRSSRSTFASLQTWTVNVAARYAQWHWHNQQARRHLGWLQPQLRSTFASLRAQTAVCRRLPEVLSKSISITDRPAATSANCSRSSRSTVASLQVWAAHCCHVCVTCPEQKQSCACLCCIRGALRTPQAPAGSNGCLAKASRT